MKLGERFNIEGGGTLKLGTAIQLKHQKKESGDQLLASLRCHTTKAGGKGRAPEILSIKLSAMQAMVLRQVLAQKMSETGYTINDFCVTGEIEYQHEEWCLSDYNMEITESIFVHQETRTVKMGTALLTINITELVVLNRAILHTDGVNWYSESVQLGSYTQGIAQLENSFDLKDGRLPSGEMFDIWCWSPRTKENRQAQDVLAELRRIYPQKRASIGSL